MFLKLSTSFESDRKVLSATTYTLRLLLWVCIETIGAFLGLNYDVNVSASGIRKVKNTETGNSLANEPLDLTAALMLTGTDTCSLEGSCNKNSPKPGKQLCDSLQLSISMLT